MRHPEVNADVVVRELDDEAVVYDFATHKAHCLNLTALAVFRACDGRTPLAGLRRRASETLGKPVDEATAILALRELEQAGLVRVPAAQRRRFDPERRRALKRLGLGAAVTIPAVWSILAPTPAYAASAMCIVATACTMTTIGRCCGSPGQQAMACSASGCNANANQCMGIICQ